MKLHKNYLGPNAVMFGDSGCPACLGQIKLLMDNFGKNYNITYYDLSRYPPPAFITDRQGNIMLPTWVFPDGTIHKGAIVNKNKLKSLITTRGSSFGACTVGDPSIPQINSLVECGKNFPDGKGSIIPNSFMNNIKNKWGDDYLNAGVGGFRSLGPGSNDTYYSNNNLNDIRMYQPGGQLETAFDLNRTCNDVQKNSGESTYGLVYNSTNPQIVGFGKSKSRFGKSYQQMGGAYLNEPLVKSDTVRNLYGGGIQNDLPRPRSVQNKNVYIGQVKDYNPLNKFGKKKLGEGSIITLKKNKIKIN